MIPRLSKWALARVFSSALRVESRVRACVRTPVGVLRNREKNENLFTLVAAKLGPPPPEYLQTLSRESTNFSHKRKKKRKKEKKRRKKKTGKELQCADAKAAARRIRLSSRQCSSVAALPL